MYHHCGDSNGVSSPLIYKKSNHVPLGMIVYNVHNICVHAIKSEGVAYSIGECGRNLPIVFLLT